MGIASAVSVALARREKHGLRNALLPQSARRAAECCLETREVAMGDKTDRITDTVKEEAGEATRDPETK